MLRLPAERVEAMVLCEVALKSERILLMCGVSTSWGARMSLVSFDQERVDRGSSSAW